VLGIRIRILGTNPVKFPDPINKGKTTPSNRVPVLVSITVSAKKIACDKITPDFSAAIFTEFSRYSILFLKQIFFPYVSFTVFLREKRKI
jgi:hypothetical protein